MTTIQARPRSLFCWNFNLFRDHELLTTMNVGWFRESGSFRWKNTKYRLGRESLWSGEFFLLKEGDNTPVAKATKPNFFTRRFVLRLATGTFVLSADNPFTRLFKLLDDYRTIGEIRPVHMFTRRCNIQLPETLSIPEQVFIFWLAVLMWRRGQNSSNS